MYFMNFYLQEKKFYGGVPEQSTYFVKKKIEKMLIFLLVFVFYNVSFYHKN